VSEGGGEGGGGASPGGKVAGSRENVGSSGSTEIILRTERLSKSYSLGRRRPINALNEVNLEIKRGEFVAIMGLSGSGKTTLLNILACLDKPSSGRLFLEGADLSALGESQLYKIRRDKIGFVFQSFNLLPYLNARENVELALESTKKSKSERSARARELLALVGLTGREEHRPSQLSAGEQQRVAIARALANNPTIILADEPTGNLDGKTKYEIVKLLVKLNTSQGTTIAVVTHDNQVAGETERVLRLKDGRIENERLGNLAKRKASQRKKALISASNPP
jgi:putative ABC transport system ATP-binding protein